MAHDYRFKMEPVEVPLVKTANRFIGTKLPVPESLPILNNIIKYESSNVVNQPPIIWNRAYGHTIEDAWGNKWIDFSSTIFVTNTGHGHESIRNGLKEIIDKPLLHSYSYPTFERANYLEKLAKFVPGYLEKFSLYSAGTEAVERAVKLARLHGIKTSTEKNIIVGGDGNFHGKTMGSQMVGGKHADKKWIGYLDPNMAHLEFPYPWNEDTKKIDGRDLFYKHLQVIEKKGIELKNIATFIIESFQGWGAVFYPKDYIQAMREWSKNNESLLICDEIQAGFGRTGKLFGYQYYDIIPDLVVCGKAVSSSVPLSVVMGRADIIDLDPEYTSTHGGHPLACAAGMKTIEVFERENLIEEARRKEAFFIEANKKLCRKYPEAVRQTLGAGMVFAVYIHDRHADTTKPFREQLDIDLTDRIVEKAMQKGVFLIRTGCGTLKYGPPLTITDDALIEALEVVEEAIGECLIG